MKRVLLLLGLVTTSCIAVRSQPRLDSERTPEAEAYAEEASLVFWTELMPIPYPPHHFLTLPSLGDLPAFGFEEPVANFQVKGDDSGAREGRLAKSQTGTSLR